jgi:transposase
MSQRKKPHYSLEFKRNAAQLIIYKGYTYPEATSSLVVSASALRKWVNAEKGQTLKKDNTLNSRLNLTEHDELLRLRKENARLKMEREILKKASVFFAQDMLRDINL